jgi:hypothetical protein
MNAVVSMCFTVRKTALPHDKDRTMPLPSHRIPLLLLLLLLASANLAAAQTGLQFNGSSQHVTFGTASGLCASNFTVECWFKRTGTGTTTTTGTGGWANVIPLLTKGRGEAESPANLNMNWFIGIRSDSVLVADFEEGSGPNHPIGGVTTVRANAWYHAAVTYQASTGRYRLLLNGIVEKDTALAAGITPASTSIQHAAIATALTSTGVAAGYFAGVVDEARVWNRSRDTLSIRDSMGLELTSGGGLLGRWGLNEGSGTVANNSVGGGASGTLVSAPTWVTGSPFAPANALRLGSGAAVVSLGNPAALGLSQFTLECWFRRDGTGATTGTGTGGLTAIPLVTKGRSQSDGDVRDMNYFLGINGADSVLAADFEEGATGTTPGLNHPVYGNTPVSRGAWHHAAATYDGTTWRLYLDGNLDGLATVGQPPRWDSAQRFGLGTAYDTSGTAAGAFDGALDEVRVWNYARTRAGIDSTLDVTITAARAGLVGRWGLDEGAGRIAYGGAGTSAKGTIAGSGWSWTSPAPFDAVPSPPTPPAAPVNVAAVAPSFAQVHVSWTDASDDELDFEVQRSNAGSGGPWSALVTLGEGVTSYDDDAVGPGATYCYRVRATNLYGASGWAAPACASTPAEAEHALSFGGTNAYVSFGDPSALHLTQFTTECWFRRDGDGVPVGTGTAGVNAIPLLTRGRHQSDGDVRDMNFFLGIRDSDNVLAADFEEGSGGTTPGLNHPVAGVTPVSVGVWHHAAASYDGNEWRLYLDGRLESVLAVGEPPQSASVQKTALATAMDTSGVAEGFFQGLLDEARVWDHARTQGEIDDAINTAITSARTGLVARWGLNENAGSIVHGSAATTVNGIILGTDWSWSATAAPFNLAVNHSPAAPAIVNPAPGASGVARNAPLSVAVSDPDADPLTVRFYGRAAVALTGADFSIAVLPDAQFYTATMNGGTPATFEAQTRWLATHVDSLNLAYVAQVGDITNDGDSQSQQWANASDAMSILEDNALTHRPNGLPYGVAVGNHDQVPNGDPDGTTDYYNAFFGYAHFAGRPWYGGHFGTNGDNHFELFSAGGLDLIAIHVEYGRNDDAVLAHWADSLLKAYPGRQALVVSHNLIGTGTPGAWQNGAQLLYDALRGNPNLFLMLCGHASGEGARMDVFQGDTVHTLLADYQNRPNGGDGWLRLVQVSPSSGAILVHTYSPTLDSLETDANSQFTLARSFSPPFQLIGTVTGVPSGSNASLTWSGLVAFTAYDWFATSSDTLATIAGATARFTTGSSTTVGDGGAPAPLSLAPARPNPFVTGTQLAYSLPAAGPVRLSVHDVSGRCVATLVDGTQPAGAHVVRWDARGTGGGVLPPGAYFARLQAAGREEVRRLVLLR